MTPRKSYLVTLVCPICNRDFEVVRRLRSKRKYCSQACAGKAKKDAYIGRHFVFHKLNDEKEKEICRLYTDEKMPAMLIAPLFDVSVATIIRVVRKHHLERTTSEAALLRAQQHPEITKQSAEKKRGMFIGEKSFLYKNGSGRWATNIFERDNYTCQDCGLHEPEIVEAHHIISKMADPEKQFDLSNGVTLCPNCHKRRHIQTTKNGTLRSKTCREVE
ncbi:MAG: HNH endonuclease [Anaerolineae bacterium]